jgi:hypothetical protein
LQVLGSGIDTEGGLLTLNAKAVLDIDKRIDTGSGSMDLDGGTIDIDGSLTASGSGWIKITSLNL